MEIIDIRQITHTRYSGVEDLFGWNRYAKQ